MSSSRGPAIVTGGASGIGRAVTHRLALDGYPVVIWDISQEVATEAVQGLQASGAQAASISVDVSDRESVAIATSSSAEMFGPPEALVTCAGVSDSTEIADLSTEAWYRVLRTNLDGVFFCIAEVAGSMIANGVEGRIVTISSTAALSGFSKRAAYCASKTGVLGLTRAAALDLARHKIRINSIAPGSTRTPLTAKFASDPSIVELVNVVPMKRWAEADEIAAAASFLIGPDSSFVTGIVLPVDGGWTAGRVSLSEGGVI